MKSKPQSIFEIFKPECQYIIPIFQRHYVWNRQDQWEPLWEDLIAQIRVRLDGRAPKPHYCGAIVIDEKARESISAAPQFHVIDGQQRLTTFQILLAALRDVCIKRNNEVVLSEIAPLVFNRTFVTSDSPPDDLVKLRPTKFDRAHFYDTLFLADREKIREKYVPKYKPGTKGAKAEKASDIPNTVGAYLFFYDQISRLFSNPEETFGSDANGEEQIASCTASALRNDFHSVVILLDNADDAQIIFESLNYRGQPLLASDLIRNFAFMRAEQRKENVEQIYDSEWSTFEQRFWIDEDRQGRIKKPRLEFFFTNFLASNMATEINQNRIYQEYLEWITPRKADLSVKDELALVVRNAGIYRTLVDPEGAGQLADFGRFCSAFDIN